MSAECNVHVNTRFKIESREDYFYSYECDELNDCTELKAKTTDK